MARGRWSHGGGSGAPGAHLKSMGSYETHAWRDALAIACMVEDFIGASKARAIYKRMDQQEVWKYEDAMEAAISEFIGRSDSQRPAAIRKLPDDVTRVCFMTLAILGCVRARDLMELRDRYRELLAPGRGNRETTSGLYAFSNRVQELFEYEWPDEVFAAAGLDDGVEGEEDEEENGDIVSAASATSAVATLKPTIPPPPPQVHPADRTEVLVTIGKSETVSARTGVEGAAWKLQVIEHYSETVLIALLPKEAPRDALVEHLVKLGDQAWGSLPTMLLFSESQRELASAVNAAAGRDVAALMRKGVSSLACMKWPEELLRALKRELELVGEMMVTAQDLVDCNASTLITGHADPKAQWQEQRDDIEGWVKTILAHRGRWVGEVKIEESTARYLRSTAKRDIAKAKRTVTKLMHESRTAYGDAIYEITRALVAWRNDQMTTQEAKAHAARAFVEYRFRTTDESRGEFLLGYELDEAFGAGSAEMDLLEAGVLDLLNGPFESGQPAQAATIESASWSGYGTRVKTRGWFHAWWCVLAVDMPGDCAESKLWLPSETALVTAASTAMPEGVTLRVSGSLVPLDRKATIGSQTWVDSDKHACQGHGSSLIKWIDSGGSYVSYDGYNASEDCTHFGLLVVAHGLTREAVLEARGAWSNAAQKLAARIRVPDVKGKRPAAPRSLRVHALPQDFFESLIMTRERLALMAGRAWDANTRTALAHGSASTSA